MPAPDLCIHHMPCVDGFTSAWAVWKKHPDTTFFPGVYGEEPPDVTGKHVLMVDFSYKRFVMEALAEKAASLTVLDHHKTAEADLSPLLASGLVLGEFDMTRSGALMTWEWLHGTNYTPPLVLHVSDRDLWRFAMRGTREVHAVLTSYPYDFGRWNEMDVAVRDEFGDVLRQGAAILRKHDRDVAELVELSRRTMEIGGHVVPVANLPYTMASDGAGSLAEGQFFGAAYYDRADGSRVFSLRSKGDGLDVSEIAKAYGGGGHARAAGFTAPPGWEGGAPWL